MSSGFATATLLMLAGCSGNSGAPPDAAVSEAGGPDARIADARIADVSVQDGELPSRWSLPSGRGVPWRGNVGVDGDIPADCVHGSVIEASAGVADDTRTIQSALDAASPGECVLLGGGSFTISGTLTMRSGVVLRGAGMSATTLTQTDASAGATLSFGSGAYGSAVDLSSGLMAGSTTITAASAHGWSAGDIILIDQLNGGVGHDPPTTNVGGDGTCAWCGRDSGTRAMGQLVELVTASGATATLDIPLYVDFDPAQMPQGVELEVGASFAGVEHLAINNSGSMNDNQDESGTINMSGTSNCWLLDVEIHGAKRMGINLSKAYRDTIRRTVIHKTQHYTSNNGYAIWLRDGASANLIESCVFYDLATGPIYNGPTSGNVLSYNYITDLQSTDYPTAVRGAFVSHGAHPMMNLFEGNHCDGQYVSADTYWGSSSHNTYFRNRIAVDPTKSAQEVTVALDYRSYYYNIIGNVLGDGREESYVLGELPYGPNTIFSFEWSGSDSTEETSLIHANYDYFHAAQTPCDHADNPGCQSASDDMTLPDSLYLDSKPAFFGTQPWPPVDPSVPSVADLPAKIYYDTRSWPVP